MKNVPSGRLHLPLHLKWSGPQDYDLSEPKQLWLVYEIILSEGRAVDIRYYVDPDELRRLWRDLFLPPHVARAWDDFFAGAAAEADSVFSARERPDVFYTALTPLQRHLARLFLSLPAAAHFALCGGAALVFRQAVPRVTKDLDFFGTLLEEVRPAAKSFLKRLGEEGLQTEIVSTSPVFVRLRVRDAGGEEVLVDIGSDSRLREPELTEIGRVLTLEELATDKLLALFGRARARDFVDVFFLARRFGIRAMLAWAREKDPGFDPYHLALGLGRFESLPRAEFEVGEEIFLEMADFFRALSAELIADTLGQ